MRIGTHKFDSARATIMGIINVTPDSFSDGGQYQTPEAVARRAVELEGMGADIIDIGGESSRPGAELISADEELRRVIPAVEEIRKWSSVPISIDTTKSQVAVQAVQAGADMVNDISAGKFDPHMYSVIAKLSVPYCLMHMRGNPQTMQDHLDYDDVVQEVFSSLDRDMKRALDSGVEKGKIILDPGIGFGKSADQDLELLQRLQVFHDLGCPLLIGTSRKKFFGKLLNLPIEERLEATLATLSFSRRKGASIFRVHDVAEARRYLDMVDLLERGGR